MIFTALSFLRLIHGLLFVSGGNVSSTICYKTLCSSSLSIFNYNYILDFFEIFSRSIEKL